MDIIFDWLLNNITLLLAIWGAGLSSYLGIRSVIKDRRRLQICLELQEIGVYVEEIEDYTSQRQGLIRLINTGHRPITIISIFPRMEVQKIGKNKDYPLMTAFGSLDGFLDLSPDNTGLPVTLSDGEDKSFNLRKEITKEIWTKARTVRVTAYDAEGNPYSNFDVLWHQESGRIVKWTNWPKPERRCKFWVNTKWHIKNIWRKLKR
jgi:hypothetical protein